MEQIRRIIVKTIINTDINIVFVNNEQSNSNVNLSINEINFKKEYSIQIDKLVLNRKEKNYENSSIDSNRVEIEFHQLGSGKIEDFVIENANIESNLLNTVSRMKLFK